MSAPNREGAYRDSVGVFLPNAFGLSLALLERVFVLEFGAHVGCWVKNAGGLTLYVRTTATKNATQLCYAHRFKILHEKQKF
jgi:hypothetical protein